MDAFDHKPCGETEASPAETTVIMEGISSLEYFLEDGQDPVRVLKDISLRIKRAECWGITGGSAVEVKLLLEIMGNIRPYDAGRCVLIEKGMMRHKRIILPHVFYIGGTQMPYNNMAVLEYLMLALKTFEPDRVRLQEQLLDFLLRMGLGEISLTPVAELIGEQKSVVSLAAASFSHSDLIIFNLPELSLDGALTTAVAQLSEFIRRKGNTLVLGTKNSELIERACSHTAYIKDGELLYRGSVGDLKRRFDTTMVIVRDKDIFRIRDELTALLPGCRLTVKDGGLLIGAGHTNADEKYIFDKINESGLLPDTVLLNPKSVENAYEELVKPHDL